jgi:hypothetical protein
MKRISICILGLLAALPVTANTVHSPTVNPFLTILSCKFEEEGRKGEDGRECTVTFSVLPTPDRTNPNPLTPGNQFIVRCDDDTVYDGGAFFNAFELSSNPHFGTGIVAANTNITASFPAVWVDGDFVDSIHGFDDVAARLRLSHDDVIHGRCDHKVVVR